MKYYGKIQDPKDFVTKEYVDDLISDLISSTGIGIYGNELTPVSDANDAVPTGFYCTDGSTLNLPNELTTNASKTGMIFTVAHATWVHQLFYVYTFRVTFFRYKVSGSEWTEWASNDANYYNADPAVISDESSRRDAIQTLFTNLGGNSGLLQRNMLYGIIRYKGGYYGNYLFLGNYSSGNYGVIVEILKYTYKKITIWTSDSSGYIAKLFAFSDDTAVNNSISTAVNTAKTNLGKGILILCNGNTHAEITKGQYVYVYNHSTLAEGSYRASANIAANGTLSTSNLVVISIGVVNACMPKYGDVTLSVPADTSWITCPVKTLLDIYSSQVFAVEAFDPDAASSSNFIIWKSAGWSNLAVVRIDTSGTNLVVRKDANEALKLRIWYK